MSGGGRDPGFGRSPAGRSKEAGVRLTDEHRKSSAEEDREEVERILPDKTGTGFLGISEAEKEGGAGEEKKAGADGVKEGEEDFGVGEEFMHGSECSLLVTFGLLIFLAICGGLGGGVEWFHFAVFGGGYGLYFALTCWSERRWGDGGCGQAATGFLESRLAVLMGGVGAVVFGSPGLLELAPDVLAIAGACGGMPDGYNVGELSKRMRCSWVRALWLMLRASGDVGRAPGGLK